MKNIENKINNKETTESGAIGIGAMIVFIALILVAAVASAVIIQTGEKLQQNAQKAGDDTSSSMNGKITIMAAYVDSSSDLAFLVKGAPGSDSVSDADIVIRLDCETNGETLQGDGASVTISTMGDTTAVNDITTDSGFIMTVSPGVCTTAGEETTMYIHIKGMGSTYETFTMTTTAGELVI